MTSSFTKQPLDQAKLDELEDMLIEADLGPYSAARITKAFSDAKFGKSVDEREIKEALAQAIGDELSDRQGVFDPLSGPRPYVVLFIGVNGSGKTTTLGKIAADLTGRGAKVLVVAGDTFRAAAVEQLKVWAQRAKAGFISRPANSDAAGLAFDAIEKAKAEAYDVVLIDTAGRLQNKQGLMDELLKVTTNAGSYVSESDFFERSWQQSFWGSNYPRLAAVKKKYDPAGLFFVHQGVGSEEWSADGFTRLVRR